MNLWWIHSENWEQESLTGEKFERICAHGFWERRRKSGFNSATCLACRKKSKQNIYKRIILHSWVIKYNFLRESWFLRVKLCGGREFGGWIRSKFQVPCGYFKTSDNILNLTAIFMNVLRKIWMLRSFNWGWIFSIFFQKFWNFDLVNLNWNFIFQDFHILLWKKLS